MSFKGFFNWIFGLPVAAAAILFAVANRQWITVSLDPIQRDAPRLSVDLPLWTLLFCGVLIGILAGWGGAWFAHGKWRRAMREARIELLRTQNEHERMKREYQSRALAPAGDTGP